MLLLALGTVLAFLSAQTSATPHGGSACAPGNFLCVNATVVDTNIYYDVTPMLSHGVGWVGIGFGKHMVGTHMVLMWENEDGTLTYSQRFADGHREPRVVDNPARPLTVTQPYTPSLQTNTTDARFSFSVPIEGAGSLETHSLIYAVGGIHPKSPDTHEHLAHHARAGALTLNLTPELVMPIEVPASPADTNPTPPPAENTPTTSNDTSILAPESSSSRGWIIFAHGTLLSLGFLVILPAGSLLARWTRSFSPAWFQRHRLLNMYISVPLIGVGWILAPLSVWRAGGSHFSDKHQLGGVIVLVLYILQLRLGSYIHSRKLSQINAIPAPNPHPLPNIAHVVFGISIMSLAFFQVRSGFTEWETSFEETLPKSFRISLLVWACVIAAAYTCGFALLPRQFASEKATASKTNPIALSSRRTDSERAGGESENTPLYSVGNDSEESVHDEKASPA